MTIDGQVKLCDFGISGELVNSLAGSLTGTSYHMAPERIQRKPYTVISDVWSLGLTLLEVAMNRFPYPGALMSIELLSIIVSQPSPVLKNEEHNTWSPEFHHFIQICLEPIFGDYPAVW